MEIYLENTLSRKKEIFKPLKKGIFGKPKVGIYHCGPTVYWHQTIGNMRAMVMADVVRRTFLLNGYKVNFVRNYTDVGHLTGDNLGDADSGEDRMEKAAKRERLSPLSIADKYIKAFNKDISSLNVLPPTHAPRATDHIPEMIKMVEALIKNGCAYATPHAIYFDVEKFPEYTKLSGQKLDELETGEGHGSVGDPDKRNRHDFAVWFFKAGAHKDALQTWPSPFVSPLVENGRGFPGWHIECSAMSKKYLGETFDVHMGGIEHVPIHHTNEIAQSECANCAKFVNYWLHNEHLLVDGKKMGKSEGNAYLMKDIAEKGFDPLALRYFFLQAHYRSKQNFTWEALLAASKALEKLREFVSGVPQSGKILPSYMELFTKSTNDDFNAAGALAVTWDLIKDKSASDADKKATILKFDEVLGLNLSKLRVLRAETGIYSVKEGSARLAHVTAEANALLGEREAARTAKNWKKSDELRDKLASLGYEVKDTPQGQKVSKK